MARRSCTKDVRLTLLVVSNLVAGLHAGTEHPHAALSSSALPRRGVAPVRLLCCGVNTGTVPSSAASAVTDITGWLTRKCADLRACVSPCVSPSVKLPAFTHWVNSRREMHPEIDATAFRNTPKGVSAVNEEMVAALLELDRAAGWRRVKEEKGSGIAVFRSRPAALVWSHGAGPADTASRFDAIKGTGEIEAMPAELLDIFMDNARTPEFNQYCSEIEDLWELGACGSLARTKISWSATPRIGPLRPRDFVTRVHCRRLADGTCVVVNVGEKLACKEQRARGKAAGYVRMEILLGGQIMRPVPGHRHRTAYTTLIHSNPGGAMDSPLGAWLINNIAVQGPVDLIHSLRAIAAKIPR